MISLYAGSLLFVSSSYIGFQIRKHYLRRKEYLKDLIELMDIMINEITYLKTPISEIMLNFSIDKKGEIKRVVSAYTDYIKNGEVDNDILKTLHSSFLSNNENMTINRTLISIGKSNIVNEVTKIKALRAQLELFLKNATEQYTTTGVLAYKLGILAGIALMIIVA
jgi:stage III sporulation protein AB